MKPGYTLSAALMIAVIGISGCKQAERPRTFTLTLKAQTDATGKPAFDKDHDDVAIFPGETVRWECDCPEIDSFAVRDVEHLASIDELVELYLHVKRQGGIEGMRESSARAMTMFEAAGEATPEQLEAAAALMESYNALLDRLEATTRTDPGPAFEKAVSEELVPADGFIESAPYRDITGNHIWKFSWVISKDGQEVRWDPHFSGHRRR